MYKSDTMAQVVIIENGKFILKKHQENKYGEFSWTIPEESIDTGMPGKERTLSVESYDSTTLKIKLMPFKVETSMQGAKKGNGRFITFLAYPVSSSIKAGYDSTTVKLLHLKNSEVMWQDFYDDSNLDELSLNCIKSWRNVIDSQAFTKRSGALIYKIENGKIYYLLISSLAVSTLFMMPQGHVEEGEIPEEAAVREAKEEAGAVIELEKRLGFFIHEARGKCFKTDIFLARFIQSCIPEENREIGWFSYEEATKLNLHYDTKNLLSEANYQLCKHYC